MGSICCKYIYIYMYIYMDMCIYIYTYQNMYIGYKWNVYALCLGCCLGFVAIIYEICGWYTQYLGYMHMAYSPGSWFDPPITQGV